jgi:hypothetical protein
MFAVFVTLCMAIGGCISCALYNWKCPGFRNYNVASHDVYWVSVAVLSRGTSAWAWGATHVSVTVCRL